MKGFISILTLLLFCQFSFGQSSISLSRDSFFNQKEINKSDEKFTFAIIGDKTGGGEFNWPIFDRAVDEINLLQPDFAIMIGDMIQGAVSDEGIIKNMWKEFNSHAQRLNVPLLVIPGNHDMSNEVMYDYWENNIGLRYYSFVYKKTLFLLLNTEEYIKTGEGHLGQKQIDFVKNEIDKHSDVNQIFIFLHRPIWAAKYKRKGGPQEWEQILSFIKNKNATIIAGHWHNLIYEEIDVHPHIIHSATGGVLEEKSLPEIGYFHHYSVVTVNKDTSYISVVKPGNIFPVNIATKEFVENAENIVKYNNNVEYEKEDGNLKAISTFSLENKLNQTVNVEIKINNFGNNNWKFNNDTIIVSLAPNESKQINFEGNNNLKTGVPFPRADYNVKIGDDTIDEDNAHFVPDENAAWRSPESVLILGAFPLGIKEKPRTKKEVNNIPIFNNSWKQDKTFIENQLKNGKEWKKLQVTDNKINVDEYFYDKDFSAAYVKFNIYSPEKKLVLAAVRPDNYCKVYLNGENVLNGYPLKGVPGNPYMFLLPLKKGNNRIVLKIADYYGNWYTQFKLIDPDKELLFLKK
ncbi:MAG: metallophosphoesterase [Bacteroidota bacterium]